jgi:hypothetical protein
MRPCCARPAASTRRTNAPRFADAWPRPTTLRSQALWRQAEARVSTEWGELEDAERLAREAIAVLEQTDMIEWTGYSSLALAGVLARAGRTDEAAVAIEDAIGFFERKGLVIPADRARTELAKLRPGEKR